MSNLWDRFESIATPTEVQDAKNRFAPVDAGEYECVLESIEATENKDGLPMIKGKFRMLEGGRTLFYNQNLQNLSYPNLTAQNIADACVFISGLLGETYEFDSMSNFAEKIGEVPIGGTHVIKVSYNEKKDTEHKYPKLSVVVTTSSEPEEPLPFNL